jgi:hypothetical protein
MDVQYSTYHKSTNATSTTKKLRERVFVFPRQLLGIIFTTIAVQYNGSKKKHVHFAGVFNLLIIGKGKVRARGSAQPVLPLNRA